MDQQRSSGMTIEAFCDQHGLAVSTFFVWRRKLREPDVPAFVEWGAAGVDDDGNGTTDDAAPQPPFEPGFGDDLGNYILRSSRR